MTAEHSDARPPAHVSHLTITSDRQLAEYCEKLAAEPWIAFDTEFVSEHSYRPVLCLAQVATREQVAVIDALEIDDMTPFWEAIAAEGHETIVHAGRGEIEFCIRAVGRQPVDLIDIQIAAGLVGIEYPASYRTLLVRLLDEKPNKDETRTDWRWRPLSERQIRYAVDDARHLVTLRRRDRRAAGRAGSLGVASRGDVGLAGRSPVRPGPRPLAKSLRQHGTRCAAAWQCSASCGGGANRWPSGATVRPATCSATT